MCMAWHDSKTLTSDDPACAGHSAKISYPRVFIMLTGRKVLLTLAFAVVLAVAFGVSCNGFFVDPVLQSITVGPANQNVQQGTTLQMSAQGTYDTQPPQDITGKVLWSSSDATATVSKSGLLTAVKAPGSPTITATLGTITGTTTENVVLTGVTAITISPKTATVRSGGSQPFTCGATVTGVSQPVDITAQATWSTSDKTNTQISNGANPAMFTVTGTITTNETVTVTVSYTVNTTTYTDTATVTVTP